VERNLLVFLRERKALRADCSVTIQVLSYRRYCDEVQRILGRPPLAVPEVDATVPDSTAVVLQRWRERLEARDRVVDAMDHFQLRGEDRREDEPFPVPESALRCPWLSYVAHTMSLTAAGDWRICCNDFHGEGVLGNVFTEPLAEIAGPRRARFLRALLANDLDQLPRRCTRKRYCQYIT
jgi:hypothetical protein